MRWLVAMMVLMTSVGACSGEDEAPEAVNHAPDATTSSSDLTAPEVSTTPSADEVAPSLTVTPTAGSASAETVLTVTGTGCREGAILWLAESGVELEGAQAATSDADGMWQGRLNIDSSDSPSGSYEVMADCYSGPGQVAFRYAAVPIDVLP